MLPFSITCGYLRFKTRSIFQRHHLLLERQAKRRHRGREGSCPPNYLTGANPVRYHTYVRHSRSPALNQLVDPDRATQMSTRSNAFALLAIPCPDQRLGDGGGGMLGFTLFNPTY
jgi:hypothetical protein